MRVSAYWIQVLFIAGDGGEGCININMSKNRKEAPMFNYVLIYLFGGPEFSIAVHGAEIPNPKLLFAGKGEGESNLHRHAPLMLTIKTIPCCIHYSVQLYRL